MASKQNTKAKRSTAKRPQAQKAIGTEKARKAAIAEIQERLDGKAAKPAARAKAAAARKPKRLSALDAAAKVLADSGKPARCKELIGQMEAKGLWKSPGGKTPEATLSAAILREMTTKGTVSRFKKVERGLFAATGKA